MHLFKRNFQHPSSASQMLPHCFQLYFSMVAHAGHSSTPVQCVVTWEMTSLYYGNGYKNIEDVNRVVISIQFYAYVLVFASDIGTNIIKSKLYRRCLLRLAQFDASVKLTANQTQLYFAISVALTFLSYVVIADFVIGVLILKSATIERWLGIFVPLLFNYVMCVFASGSFYYLYVRYDALNLVLDWILSHGSEKNGAGGDAIRKFTKLYIDLTSSGIDLITCFSLSIATSFLVAMVVVTNYLYLCIKVRDYNALQYVTTVNFILVHVVKVAMVVYVAYKTNFKASELQQKMSLLLLVDSEIGGIGHNKIQACVVAIQCNTLSFSLLGMFNLDPAAVLGMSASIATYLVISLQFSISGTQGKVPHDKLAGFKHDISDEILLSPSDLNISVPNFSIQNV